MHTVHINEVPNLWGLLIKQAEAGETIVIVEHGRPRAVLSPYHGSGPYPGPDAATALPRWAGSVIGNLRREDLYAGHE